MTDGSRASKSDWVQIVDVVNGYARALDSREWGALANVFVPEVHMDFGLWQADGLANVVAQIRSHLDGCGTTQHLLGNYEIEIDGDSARSKVYMRAFHRGQGARDGLTYEVGGEYHDELVRTSQGWRITRRLGLPRYELGDRSVLGPG